MYKTHTGLRLYFSGLRLETLMQRCCYCGFCKRNLTEI